MKRAFEIASFVFMTICMASHVLLAMGIITPRLADWLTPIGLSGALLCMLCVVILGQRKRGKVNSDLPVFLIAALLSLFGYKISVIDWLTIGVKHGNRATAVLCEHLQSTLKNKWAFLEPHDITIPLPVVG